MVHLGYTQSDNASGNNASSRANFSQDAKIDEYPVLMPTLFSRVDTNAAWVYANV